MLAHMAVMQRFRVQIWPLPSPQRTLLIPRCVDEAKVHKIYKILQKCLRKKGYAGPQTIKS
jgi:hypothetical protein